MDKLLVTQYFNWLRKALHGDLGTSLTIGDDIWTEYKQKFSASAALFLAAELFPVVIALPSGDLAERKANSLTDSALRFVAVGSISVRNF